MSKIITVIGGISSGKSQFAEQTALSLGKNRTYIATSEITDDEMRLKIQKHIDRRSDDFVTIEDFSKIDLVIQDLKTEVCMIDCITNMLNNLMYHSGIDFENCSNDEFEEFANATLNYVQKIISAMRQKEMSFVIVTNELGLSTIDVSRYTRRFVSLHGIINQKICTNSDEVYNVIAGIVNKIK